MNVTLTKSNSDTTAAMQDSQFDDLRMPDKGRLLLCCAPRQSGRTTTLAKVHAFLYSDPGTNVEIVTLFGERQQYFEVIDELYEGSCADQPEMQFSAFPLEKVDVILVDDIDRQPAWLIRKLA